MGNHLVFSRSLLPKVGKLGRTSQLGMGDGSSVPQTGAQAQQHRESWGQALGEYVCLASPELEGHPSMWSGQHREAIWAEPTEAMDWSYYCTWRAGTAGVLAQGQSPVLCGLCQAVGAPVHAADGV